MKWLFVIPALMVFFVGCSQQNEITLTPEEALRNFYINQGAEDQLMDPLIIAGSGVVPLVLTEVENTNMVNRRYAIGALGNVGDRRALIMLEKILASNAEQGFFRCDAITAIGMIDFNRAKELSLLYKNNPVHCLKEESANILSSQYQVWLSNNHRRRTIEEARLGLHD